MPKLRGLLPEIPKGANPKLPSGDPNSMGQTVEDFIMGLLGQQKPGELDSALGAAAGLLGPGLISKIFRRVVPAGAPQLAKEIEAEIEAFKARPVPGSMAEFTPVGGEPPRPTGLRRPDISEDQFQTILKNKGRLPSGK